MGVVLAKMHEIGMGHYHAALAQRKLVGANVIRLVDHVTFETW